jgi:hypothetical protein
MLICTFLPFVSFVSCPRITSTSAPLENLNTVPFTEEGIRLLEGTKAFLVEEKLAAQDFKLDDWILK